MSYTAHTWTNGETITAAKMNNIENGVANAGANYDVIIQIENSAGELYLAPNLELGGESATLVKGNYASLLSKVQGGDCPSGVVCMSGVLYDTTCVWRCPIIAAWATSGNALYIYFHGTDPYVISSETRGININTNDSFRGVIEIPSGTLEGGTFTIPTHE